MRLGVRAQKIFRARTRWRIYILLLYICAWGCGHRKFSVPAQAGAYIYYCYIYEPVSTQNTIINNINK